MTDDDLKRAYAVLVAGLQHMVNVSYYQGGAAATAMLLMGMAINENYNNKSELHQ